MPNRIIASVVLMFAVVFAIKAQSVLEGEARLNRNDLHKRAQMVSVQLRENDFAIGTGVWISERYVVTCEHVVHDVPTGSIKIAFPQLEAFYDQRTESTMTGLVVAFPAKVVIIDQVADLAILEFTNPVIGIERGLPVAVAKLANSLPDVGTETVLSGFPLGNSEIVTQFGNVGGTKSDRSKADLLLREGNGLPAFSEQSEAQRLTADTVRLLRVLVSVVSNPGNSGGPVLDDYGRLVGVLEANENVPARNSDGTYQIVFSVRENQGMIVGEDGSKETVEDVLKRKNPAFRPMMAPSYVQENTGISVVIPALAISNLLRRCELAKQCGPLPYARGTFGRRTNERK